MLEPYAPQRNLIFSQISRKCVICICSSKKTFHIYIYVYIYICHAEQCLNSLTSYNMVDNVSCSYLSPVARPMKTYCQWDPKKQPSLKFTSNAIIFIQENAFENVIDKLSTILFRHKRIKLRENEINL